MTAGQQADNDAFAAEVASHIFEFELDDANSVSGTFFGVGQNVDYQGSFESLDMSSFPLFVNNPLSSLIQEVEVTEAVFTAGLAWDRTIDEPCNPEVFWHFAIFARLAGSTDLFRNKPLWAGNGNEGGTQADLIGPPPIWSSGRPNQINLEIGDNLLTNCANPSVEFFIGTRIERFQLSAGNFGFNVFNPFLGIAPKLSVGTAIGPCSITALPTPAPEPPAP